MRSFDIDDQMFRQIRDKGKKNDLARSINVQLQDGYERMLEELPGVADNIVMNDGIRRQMSYLWDASNHKDFMPLLDTYTNLFKTYATMTPGFHVRNAMSAVFMNSSDGVPVATQMEGVKLGYKMQRAARGGEETWNAFVRNLTPEYKAAIESAMGTGMAGQFGERGLGEASSAGYMVTEWAFNNMATRISRSGGEFVESSVRIPVVLDSIRRGAKGGIGMTDAATMGMERARYLHFDYSQVSKFDEKMKRLIPFWTFMSRNLPLQITQMWTKPRTYAKYNSFIRNFRGDAEPNTPEYFESTGYFRFGDAELGGLPMYLGPDFAHTRIEEDVANIENLVSGDNPLRFLSSFNPLYTAPAEFATGKNFFTGRQYDDTDVQALGGLEQALAPILLATNQAKVVDGKVVANEKALSAIRSVVPVYDRSARLAPGITSGSQNKDADSRALESWLRFFGAPVRQLSPQQQQSAYRSEQFNREDEMDLERALRQAARG